MEQTENGVKKTLKKSVLISITAVFSAIIALTVFLMIWFFGDKYPDFEAFRKEFEIPGLHEGAVPQGMGNCLQEYETEDGKKQTQQYFFISAYMTDKSPSRIYVTADKTGYIGYVTLLNEDGSDYKGHCGGIAINGSTLWVTSDSTVYVAKRSSSTYSNVAQEIIKKAAQTEDKTVKFTESFNANCNASFCYYYKNTPTNVTPSSSDRLYVGEFYRQGNYETAKNHRVTTPKGYGNTAFVYEYNVTTSSSNSYGLMTLSDDNLNEENQVPQIRNVYSVPEKIQGFARTKDKMVLSQSYGLANSHILVYDWKTVTATSSANRKDFKSLTGGNFKYEGVKTKSGMDYYYSAALYVYFADNNDETKFINDYSIPSMSEGLCRVGDDRVYVLFESGSKFIYKSTVRQKLENVYSVIPRKD